MPTDHDLPDETEHDDRPLPVDDRPDWLRESDDDATSGSARGFQFSIAALFWLTTVCGVYFFLERAHEGWFGLHALAAAALLFGVGLPILWLILWGLHRLIEFGTWLGMVLMGLAIVALVVFSLTRFPGF